MGVPGGVTRTQPSRRSSTTNGSLPGNAVFCHCGAPPSVQAMRWNGSPLMRA